VVLSYSLALLFPSFRLTKPHQSNGHPHNPFQARPSLCFSLNSHPFIAVPCAPPSSFSSQLISLSWLTPVVTRLFLCYCRSLFHRNMSLVVFWFLSLFFLSSLLPSRSSPISSPAIAGSHDQAFMSGDFNAEVSATTATAERAPLVPGARVLPPSTGSLVLFSPPQDPSADGFTKLLHGSSSDVASVSPESDPTVVHHNITQDQSNSSLPLMMAYYPAWVADTFPPERINFSLFDWIDFAFAVPNANYSLDWDGSEMAHDILTRLVDVAHQRGTKVKLSVGGWSGSKYVTHVVAQRRPALTLSPLGCSRLRWRAKSVDKPLSATSQTPMTSITSTESTSTGNILANKGIRGITSTQTIRPTFLSFSSYCGPHFHPPRGSARPPRPSHSLARTGSPCALYKLLRAFWIGS